MQIRLLGPIDVVVRGEPRLVHGLRRKTVLAVLALHGGGVVSTGQLTDAVWGDAAPPTAANSLQNHMSYLRGVLGAKTAILARPPGYVLQLPSDGTDVQMAERLLEQGTQSADPVGAVRLLQDALALWRGRPLADVADLAWLSAQAERLEQLRLRATRELAEARLALGEHAHLLPELEVLVKEHPFDERLHAQLMLALYRSGRQVDALAMYRNLRRVLADELGIEPGPPLRDLEAAILRQDRTLDLAPEAAAPPAVAPAPATISSPVPAAPVQASAAPALDPLEREMSLASLNEYAGQARGGEGRLVLIGGEAGAGKSALVERLQRDLPEARWSWGMCDGLFTPRPLGPLFDLADQLGGGLLERCTAGAGREELFRAMLRQVSADPVLDVVVVEDIHWADEATLDLLRYLGRRLRGTAVLLIATYRDDGLAAGDPLRVALGDLGAQRCTRRIELAPLSLDAVRELAGGSELPPDELYRLTGGNPFYVTEVLRAGLGEVPASARDAVLARAARLSGGSREVLDVAALTGSRVEARLLESVTSCAPSALDELLDSGLLAGDGEWVRFRHEIARLAVAQTVPAHRGQAIHALVLAALRSLCCDDDARLAFHAEAARDGAAVLRYAPAAARRAVGLGSHREAAAQFERALRFAGEEAPATLAGLHEGLADELPLLDRWAEADMAAERALTLWREAGDRLREGGALRRLSRIKSNMYRGRDAVAVAEAAIPVLEPLGPSGELARAYAALAGQLMMLAENDAAIGLALRAQEVAARFGATDVRSAALNTQAACMSAKDVEWAGQMRRALDIALAGNHHDQAARAFANLCEIYVLKREFAQAERCLAEGIPYCDEHDLTTYAFRLLGSQSAMLECTGRWDEAIALDEEILTKAGPSPAIRLWTLIRAGALRARRGEPGIWECLDEAAVTADETGQPQWRVPARLARAEAHWLQDRPDAAQYEAELAADACIGLDGWQRGAVATWLRRTRSPRLIHGKVAQPYRLLLDGDPAEAAQAWTRLGCTYDAAMALADAPDEAGLREALGILTSLGARPAARIIRRRLRSLGARPIPVGPRTATRAHPSGLTRREREVLDLICAEHTNAEISAKLSISAKTVGHHVSAILAKLGVPTRAAARLSLVGSGKIG
jgi:DNA-binding SARP family transcriptional activator/DNA-binding CsgD family transcriptional regulator